MMETKSKAVLVLLLEERVLEGLDAIAAENAWSWEETAEKLLAEAVSRRSS